jgi:hypothetical protein
MMPLLILALAGVAALAAYELSPKAHAWVDEHMHALAAAHQAADEYLTASKSASDPTTGAQHAADAHAANRVAAGWTAGAAKAARTDKQRKIAAQHATAVVDREREIGHVRLIHEAYAAHHAADAHLHAAGEATDPTVAAQHVAEAQAANRIAAGLTAGAAGVAGTDQQRATTTTSAQTVTERDQKIAAALAALGVGQCGVHVYEHVTSQKKDALIAKLHAEGMAVAGTNPWDIETHEHGVKLRAVWDPEVQVLRLIVTSGEGGYAGLVTCDRIWEKIDPIVKGIVGS